VSCGVAGHKQAGMVAMLHLGTGAPGGTASDADVRAQNAKAGAGMKAPDAHVATHEGCEYQRRRQPEDAPLVRADGTKSSISRRS
jgi:hypothetical protein